MNGSMGATLESLDLFIEKAIELESTPFTESLVTDGSIFNWSFHHETGTAVERRGPREESIKAFVLTLRFFVLDNEASSLRRTTATIERLVSDGQIDPALLAIWENWRGALNDYLDSYSPFHEQDEYEGETVRDERYTYRRVFEIIIYGGLAHSNNPEKVKRFKGWRSNEMILPFVMKLFVDILARFVYGLNGMRRFVIEPIVETLKRSV